MWLLGSPDDPPHPDDIHVLCLCRAVGQNGEAAERYVVMFRPETRSQAIQAVAAWAQCKALAFNWRDATKLRDKILEACPV